MVDLAQTIEEWKDIQSIKVDDQVEKMWDLSKININTILVPGWYLFLSSLRANLWEVDCGDPGV